MSKFQRLSSPEFWIIVFGVLAVIGMVFFVTGMALGISTFRIIGLFLGAPFFVGMVALMIITIPMFLYEEWKSKTGISIFQRLLSSEFWIKILGIFMAIGMAFFVIGIAAGIPKLVIISLFLYAPLPLGSVMYCVIRFLLKTHDNRKHKEG